MELHISFQPSAKHLKCAFIDAAVHGAKMIGGHLATPADLIPQKKGNLITYNEFFDNIEKLVVTILCCDEHGDLDEARRFQMYFRALHCPIRWLIIRIIGDEEKSSGEILEGLRQAGEGLARSSLYYHLSELEEAGIIELAGYREEGGGAPEKVWRLKMKEIHVNLLEDMGKS